MMMNAIQEIRTNEAAYRFMKLTVDNAYPEGRFVAFHGGQIVADAPNLDELFTLLGQAGISAQESLVVQAGGEYPAKAVILVLSGK
jgi:hypothetical protein